MTYVVRGSPRSKRVVQPMVYSETRIQLFYCVFTFGITLQASLAAEAVERRTVG